VYDWSGFYIGANGGWGSSRNCWTNNTIFAAPQPATNEGCHDATGGTAGGQIGYRWQTGAWVFGVEAQGNWADFKGSNPSLVNFGGGVGAISNRSQIDAFGLFTGQVGYAFNNVLLYVKGGAAVTDTRYQGFLTGTGTIVDTTGYDTRWGGSVGAGLEFGFTPNWSAGIEYNHLFMGTQTKNFTSLLIAPPVTTRTDAVKQDVDTVTVRVNYRWGGPVIAKY
jgi:outer membrane immunogenic protein